MLGPVKWQIAWRTLSVVVRTKPWRPFSTVARRSAKAKATPEPTVADSTRPTAEPALLLRDYQEECIKSVLRSLALGKKRLGVSLATGAGKTVIFTQLLDRVQAPSPDASQTLILAHRRELVEQAARHCTRSYPDKKIEIEMGSLHASGTADITVASIQSITSGERITKFNPNRFKLVLVDEAHHIVAPGYMRALGHFGLADKESSQSPDAPALVGVSATFSRFDGLALGAAIDEIVYHKDYIEMIGDGWLSNVIFTTVESTADLSQVRSGGIGKDFQTGDLSRAVNTPQVNEITVRTWLAKAWEAGRKSTLVFCVDLAHVADLTATFKRHGIKAQYITGDTDKVERSNRLDAFKNGEFPVLINCGVFTEGTDIPNVDCIVLARPTKSRNLLIQMIGRGMRLHKDKANCHVIDMVSSLETGIVTAPTLFGLDPSELVSGATVEDMRALKESQDARTSGGSRVSRAADVAPIKSISLTEYESVLDLISDTSGERHIRAISQYAWVQVGKDKHVLSGPTGTYLRIEKLPGRAKNKNEDDEDEGELVLVRDPHETEDDFDMEHHEPRASQERTSPKQPSKIAEMYRAVEVRALPAGISKSPFAAPREVCRGEEFMNVVQAADNYASKIFPRAFIHRYQPWRKGPPTKGQLDFINKVRGKKQEPLSDTDIDKGKASDMITKIKHGARGRFSDMDAVRKRREKKATREKEQKEREDVRRMDMIQLMNAPATEIVRIKTPNIRNQDSLDIP
ncbi:dead deah box helicase [Ophiostoma piceae UAMH 11346]|uniref:Dead deah box helicase n=1 Tax=Ophiostoma piceae (strain UAMH 11346) TaxID=1262450 RepID=S3CAA4_OPHP1|nr:dead deah box helicase [Ophiostoma piceae UAMH 11346]